MHNAQRYDLLHSGSGLYEILIKLRSSSNMNISSLYVATSKTLQNKNIIIILIVFFYKAVSVFNFIKNYYDSKMTN